MDTLKFINYIANLRYVSYRNACNNMLNNALVIGKGDYGTAFHLSDGKVVKLFKSHDLAYKKFLDLVMLTDNPHVPVIVCVDEYSKFSWVMLEYLNEYTQQPYFDLTFDIITATMTSIILGEAVESRLPKTLYELAEEMREAAKGFCLDFRPPNFACRGDNLVVIDPFTLRTKDNSQLVYVNRPEKRLKVA